MQWLKRSRRSLPGVVMMFWFLTWMQVTCERRFMLWTVWLNFVYTLSCPFSSMTRQKNQSWCVSFANSFSIILAASHCESLALAPSTHDSLSLWRHSLWKRRVWARNQVFFFFFLSSILYQPSLGRSQQMSECDFSWDYWIIGQVCFRPHFMQDWGAFIITDIYISVFFLSFFFPLKKTQLYPCIIDIRKVYSLFWNMFLHPYKHLYNQDNAVNEHINYPVVFLCPWIIPCPSLPAHSTLIYL